jgi:hypothetical protein
MTQANAIKAIQKAGGVAAMVNSYTLAGAVGRYTIRQHIQDGKACGGCYVLSANDCERPEEDHYGNYIKKLSWALDFIARRIAEDAEAQIDALCATNPPA